MRGPFRAPSPVEPSRTIILTGVVTDGSLTPIANAIVDLFDDSSRQFYGTTISNSSGVYSFVVPFRGPWRVNAKHPSSPYFGEAGGLYAS